MSRHCMVRRVRPDRLEEYRAAHRAVWPELLRELADAGWRNYSLFLCEDGLLIGCFETDDLAEAWRRVGATEVDARWQAAMGEFFADDGWVLPPEVFNLADQLAAAEQPGD